MRNIIFNQNLIAIFFSITVFLFIGFLGFSTVIATTDYATNDSFFSQSMNRIQIAFTKDDFEKAKLNLKLSRDKLNNLRRANIDGEEIEKAISEVDKAISDSKEMVSIVEDKYRKKEISISSENLLSFLTEYRNVISSYSSVLGQIPKAANSDLLSNAKKISNGNYITLSLVENDISDLLDDGKLNLSVIDSLNINLKGILVEDNNQKRLVTTLNTFTLTLSDEISSSLLNKNVEVSGIINKESISKITVVNIREDNGSNTKKETKEIKGFLSFFGKYPVFISEDYSKRYLLQNTEEDLTDFQDTKILIVGEIDGTLIDASKISAIDIKSLGNPKVPQEIGPKLNNP